MRSTPGVPNAWYDKVSGPVMVIRPSGDSGCSMDCRTTQSPSGSMPASGTVMLVGDPANTLAIVGLGAFGAEFRSGSAAVTVMLTVLTARAGCSVVLEPATAV